jgi:hypothetical protein
MTPTSIETVSGRFIDLVNPSIDQIDIIDIAWALSRMPRYVGHTVTEVPYTIGQHSIFVVNLVNHLFSDRCLTGFRWSFLDFAEAKGKGDEEALAVLRAPASRQLHLHLLLHDASEAYIVDVPTPLKQADGFRQVYQELENRMMATIYRRFDLPAPSQMEDVIVKWADAAALTIEAHHLIRSRGAQWGRLLPLGMAELQFFEPPARPIDVYQQYLNYFNELYIPSTHSL